MTSTKVNTQTTASSNPRECSSSFEYAEARQYACVMPPNTFDLLNEHLVAQGFVIDSCKTDGLFKIICCHCTKAAFNVVPHMLVKAEEFAGTTIVVIDTWGKVQYGGGAAASISIMPQQQRQKKEATASITKTWECLSQLLGVAGSLVASSFDQVTPKADLLVVPHNDTPVAIPEPKVLEVITTTEVVTTPFAAEKKKWFQRFGRRNSKSSAAEKTITTTTTTAPVKSKQDAKEIEETFNEVTKAAEMITSADMASALETVGAALGTGLNATLTGLSVVGEFGVPLIGVASAAAQFAAANTNAEKGAAIGRIVGATTGVPLAGFIGSCIGQAVGSLADGKTTEYEKVEVIIVQKKNAALLKFGESALKKLQRQQTQTAIAYTSVLTVPEKQTLLREAVSAGGAAQ